MAYLAWPLNAQMHRRLSSKQQMQQLATAAQKSAEEFSHKAASVIVSLAPFVLLLWMIDICFSFGINRTQLVLVEQGRFKAQLHESHSPHDVHTTVT